MGKSSFGWSEREDAEKRIIETIDYMQNKYRVDNNRITLLGFSQGSTTAYFLGLKNADLFKGVIVIAGFYDSTFNQYLNVAKEKGTKFVIMLGEEEPVHRIEANIIALEQFIKASISASFQVYAGYAKQYQVILNLKSNGQLNGWKKINSALKN